jgi:3-oxoacyl-[acyl-carrier protein] reductase
MKVNLKGKNALVTGSSDGIGFYIAKQLHQNGCNVVINGRNKAKLNLAKKKLNVPDAIQGDLTNLNDTKKLIKKFKKKYNRLDILVCNVGSGKSIKKKLDIEEWNRLFKLNFWSTVNIINSAETLLVKSKSSIICVSSICGLEHVPGAPIPYSVAKSALNSYVLNQSKMFGKYKIRINAIAPGNIIFDSSTWQKKIKAAPNRIKKYIKENVSLNILGKPNDISNLVVYLASDDAKYITGSIFKVDGGQIRGY